MRNIFYRCILYSNKAMRASTSGRALQPVSARRGTLGSDDDATAKNSIPSLSREILRLFSIPVIPILPFHSSFLPRFPFLRNSRQAFRNMPSFPRSSICARSPSRYIKEIIQQKYINLDFHKKSTWKSRSFINEALSKNNVRED